MGVQYPFCNQSRGARQVLRIVWHHTISKILYRLALLTPGAIYDQLDSNPDSDSKQLDPDSDSRKTGWIRIQLDSDSRCLDSDPDSDSRCLDSHITGGNCNPCQYLHENKNSRDKHYLAQRATWMFFTPQATSSPLLYLCTWTEAMFTLDPDLISQCCHIPDDTL